MTCREAELLVRPYIKNELTDDQIKAFISHVRSCPSCYEELETYYTIYTTLDVLDQDKAAEGYDFSGQLEEDLLRKEDMIRRHERNRDAFGIMIMLAELLLIICMLLNRYGSGEAYFAQLLDLLGL